MSYREENGQVILTMSREDYERTMRTLGYAAGNALRSREGRVATFELLNRLNSGNPNYTPYQVEAEKKS